jgi:hypothetical protein
MRGVRKIQFSFAAGKRKLNFPSIIFSKNMSVRIPKTELKPQQIAQIKDDCYVIGKENDYGPPETVNAWLETSNSFFVPLGYALKKLNRKNNYDYPKTIFQFIGKFKNENQAIVFDEAVKMIDQQSSTVLALHCGFGKTFEGIKLGHHSGYKTAVLAHRTILVEQWIESIQKFTTAKIQVVDTNGILDPDADFYIFNIAFVPKMWDKSKKKWVPKIIGSYKHIGMLIVDEAHIACASEMSKALFYFQPKIIIALTATPRKDGLEKVLDLHFGEHKIVRISTSAFTVLRLPTDIKPEFTLNKMGKKDWNSVIHNLSLDKKRNELITKLACKFSNDIILILTKRKVQCDILTEMLMHQGESVTKMKGNDKTYDKTARILVSTFSKLGIGFDDERLTMFIIACDVGEIEQYAGRLRDGVGKTRTIIDLVDDDPNCNAHWLDRRKWYISRNGIIKNYYSLYPDEKPRKLDEGHVRLAPKRLALKKK